MKLTVSNRLPIARLKEADEIRVRGSDINKILDYIEDDCLSKKTIIYTVPFENFDIKEYIDTLKMYDEKLDFILEVKDARLISFFTELGFKVFWAYPVNTYYDLRDLVKLKPCYINLGEPLCFDLKNVSRITKSIPLRMTANMAYDPYLERENGMYGKWIRPEDLDVYSKYICAIDFRCKDTKQEEIIFKAYRDQKWPGNLRFLITNLNKDLDNRIINDDFAERRMNCKQRCMSSGNCHYCDNVIVMNRLLRNLHDEIKQKENT